VKFNLELFDRITADWDEKNGWAAPQLRPYENLSLAPSAVVFHYASEVKQKIETNLVFFFFDRY
jgi:hypothetical protein